MKYKENKSQIWFKILDQHGNSLDEEKTQWKLPQGVKKGDQVASTSPIGTLLVINPKEFLFAGNRVFVVEFQETPMIELPGMIWINKLRLVREATNMDLKPFGIYRAMKQII